MAPPPDNVYFPPLEQLLEGETVLLSWKLVASALADSATDRLTTNAVTKFLGDAFVLSLLKAPASVFDKPTAQTAAAFETRTAAINVTPTPTEKYDIKAIKADAVWLSKAAGINEVAALRLVIMELQTRSEAFLGAPLSLQDATNIQKAAAGGMAAVPQATVDAEDLWTAFNSQESQRRRLLAIYLSERRHFAMASDYITSLVLLGPPSVRKPDETSETAAETQTAAVETIRNALAQGLLDKPADAESNACSLLGQVPTYITELRSCMRRAEQGIADTMKEAGAVLTEDLALKWALTALTEAVHYMTVIFLALQNSEGLFLPPGIVAEWFRFAGDYRFLDGLTPGDDAMAEVMLPLKTLVCVNSLQLLHLNRAIGYLDHDVDLDAEEDPYVNDADVLEVMHATIVGAAEAALATASPVFLSWSLILHRMDVSYQERAERRDLVQNQRAQDGFELDSQSQSFAAQALQPRGRRSSVGSIVSIEAARYDSFLSANVLSQGEGEAMVPRLAMAATEQCAVYDVISTMAGSGGTGVAAAFRPAVGARVRRVFLEVLKASFPIVGYQSDPLSALVAVLGGSGSLAPEETEPDYADDTVAAAVLADERLMAFYVDNALQRFPYEFAPFVQLSRLLSVSRPTGAGETVLGLLLETPSLTFNLPAGFGGYAMIDEEEHETATMQTTEDLVLFPTGTSRRRMLTYGGRGASSDLAVATEAGTVIPAGTYGRFMIDGSGIVNVDFEHSTIGLLGRWLDANLTEPGCDSVLGYLEASEAADAIGLLAVLVRAERRKGGAAGEAAGLAVLQEASRALDGAKDIVSVVCDTVDTLMQDGPGEGEAEAGRLGVLAACMDFLEAILALCPGRVWSYMARSQLLNTASRAGRLCMLTSAAEVAGERYLFLAAALRFVGALVQGAATSAVQRRMGSRTTADDSKWREDDNKWLGASEPTVSQVSEAAVQTVVDVHENTATWKFASEGQRSRVVALATGMLRDVVVYAASTEGVVACLDGAARFVRTSFVSGSAASSLRMQPLVATLALAVGQLGRTLYLGRARAMAARTLAVLELVEGVLTGTEAGETATTTMFQLATLPARLCCGAGAAGETVRRSALRLLRSLVVSAAGTTAAEPPSLLGYLGPRVSRAFVVVLSGLDGPFGRAAERARTWAFFAAILRHRQQWMASCLLTGQTPREALGGKDSKGSKGSTTAAAADSVLARAGRVVAQLGKQAAAAERRGEILAVLDFAAAAQNYWPWTMGALGDDGEALDGLRAALRRLGPSAVTARTEAEAAIFEARLAAYAAEILAMQLFHRRQRGGGAAFARTLVSDLDYLRREGVAVDGYNASLHANLQRNFAARYGGVTLAQLKRTAARSRPLGSQFYYALDLADALLGWDGAWAGSHGFRRELAAANRNLSLVDAQRSLYQAWEVLLLELGSGEKGAGKGVGKGADSAGEREADHGINTLMLQVAEQCLAANEEPSPLAELAQSRASLALLLLQRLAEHGRLPADRAGLLTAVWTSISRVEGPWTAEQAPYYRTLLRILYVVLRGGGPARPAEGTEGTAGAKAASEADAVTVSTTQTLLTILDRVVAAGFRTLVGLVHDGAAETRPDDMALLTAVLQACLAVPALRQCDVQVLNVLAAHDVLRVAVSLFSWADRLLVDGGDPVYGELSLLFLRELSALPVVAEQLAGDGLLAHLAGAGLAAHMRRPGVAPLAESPAAQRCYSIWAKAVLPLLLNLLLALGTAIAPEVAYVLNQFPALLAASVPRFEAPGGRTATAQPTAPITLLATNEVHALALLTQVLAALRVNHAREIPAVAWPAASMREAADFWLSRPKLLRERLVPLGAREAEWRSQPVARPGEPAENRLEERVLSLLDAVKTILTEEDDDDE